MTLNPPLGRKLRMGLVGGGPGAFIGRVHVTAACMDGRAELVAGALSSDAAKTKACAGDYGISADRAYGCFVEMAKAEAGRAPGDRIDFVTIATPNDTHFEIAQTFAEQGFHIFCDKPMTFDLAQARSLSDIVRKSGIVFVLTHNYCGYPLVRQARDMAAAGELGETHAVRVSYLQGWLRTRLEQTGQKQAAWRTDPARSGAAGCFGDIGTHAYHLLRYVSGLAAEQVSCTLKTFERGRRLDDYGCASLRLQGGALGSVIASQISHGYENDLRLEVDGTKASLEWRQEEPNRLIVRANGQPERTYKRDPGASHLSANARASCRLPAGHPEAFLEAFANVYTAAYPDIAAAQAGKKSQGDASLYPTVLDGVDEMNFIAQCVASSAAEGQWKSMTLR
jgi:predicted dehydrogenase